VSRFTVGADVVSLVSGIAFTVAGVDDDFVLRAEDGAWLHEDDVDLAQDGPPMCHDPESLAPLYAGELGIVPLVMYDGGVWA